MSPLIQKLVVDCMVPASPKTALIQYRKSSGEIVEREVEPYEIKGDRMFAYCLADAHVKQFLLENIISATPGAEFKPRRTIIIPT